MSAKFADVLASIPTTEPTLTVPVGVTQEGRLTCMDLAKAPHALYAGVTGSGKSVGLNVAIATIMARATPETVRFRMVDPKRVELSQYRASAFVDMVVTDMDEAAGLIEETVREMDRRYSLFESTGVKSLDAYNETAETREPYIVLVIDELADLMDTHRKVVEPQIIRLGQLARAAGIHMLMATQRPGADTVPKRILSNIPTRIGYRTQSHVESRLILGEKGAEELKGNGDLLALIAGGAGLTRAQGPFISDEEIAEIVLADATGEVEPAELEDVEEFDEPVEPVEPVEEPEVVEPTAPPAPPATATPDPNVIAAVVAEVSAQTRAQSEAEIGRLAKRVRELDEDNDRLAAELEETSRSREQIREELDEAREEVLSLERIRMIRDEDAAVLRRMRRQSAGLAARQSAYTFIATLVVAILGVMAVVAPESAPVVAVATVALTGLTGWMMLSNLINASPPPSKRRDWP